MAASKTHNKTHDRKFYSTDFSIRLSSIHSQVGVCDGDNSDRLMQYIHDNIIGDDYLFNGPFGERRALYLDYTASGRSLRFIEDYIRNEVLPCYGNTHTTTSVTSLQTTLYRHEARDIVRTAVNASEHDTVIFTGSGCTGAVNKLVHGLNLMRAPIVFVGPFEHHSNLLPWREIADKVVRIKQTEEGILDMNDLEYHLKRHETSGRPLLGCFSAASNVTGILTDTNAVTVLLHRYGARAFWDYAAAAPYTKIDMNPLSKKGKDQNLIHKDAIFFSIHKFIGGVQTPGVLVAKRHLFINPVPLDPGGGTVYFVTRKDHTYHQNIEIREEGGTPAIVESIRGGLVLQLKQSVGAENIMRREAELVGKALESWSSCKTLVLLGRREARRIPIFSFLIHVPELGTYLHHNFICAILNDVYGIQSRGGCACAGPYAMDLLGIDEDLSKEIEDILKEDHRLDRIHLRRKIEGTTREILRPGFARVNLPFFLSNPRAEYVIRCVKDVAENGWKLLPQYLFNPETGEWKHHTDHVFKDRKWLGAISYESGEMRYPIPALASKHPTPQTYEEVFDQAAHIYETAAKKARRLVLSDELQMFDEVSLRIHWFSLPSEAWKLLCGRLLKKRLPAFNPAYFNSEEGQEEVDTGRKEEIETEQENSTVTFTHAAVVNGSESDESDFEAESVQSDDETEDASASARETCKRHLSVDSNMIDEMPSPLDTHKHTWYSPPKTIYTPFIKAANEFKMFNNNDRVLVCLSGGKDSLSLLHTIKQYQYYAAKQGINFEFGAVTVDPGSAAYNPRPLIDYLSALKVDYFYEEQAIIEQASSLSICDSICSFCSRMKRGRIYACARREGYNVIALGQHLDDLAESFFMSVFHNGRLRTMKANYVTSAGDLRVIRPFVYAREKHLREFAEGSKLPIIAENCPACFEAPKERHRIKQMLASQEVMFPKLFKSVCAAMKPLVSVDKTGQDISLPVGLGVKEESPQYCRNISENSLDI